MKRALLLCTLLMTLLAACGPSPEEIATQTASAWTETPLPTKMTTPTEAPTSTPEPTSTPTVIPSPTPPFCLAGVEMVDAENDVELGHVDILKVTSSIEDETLEVVFYLRELPEEITINRDEVDQGYVEYVWAADIDVDNDPDTGSEKGVDYMLMVFHFKQGAARTGAIDEVLRAQLGKYKSKTQTTSAGTGTLSVDMDANTLTLSGKIPGITSDSKITFNAFDKNPGGQPSYDTVVCQVK